MGACALVVLIADLAYASSRWGGSFTRSFMVSLIALAVVAVIALAVRFVGQIGIGRQAARWNQRGMNVVFIVVLVAFIEVSRRVGGDFTGEILGAFAMLAGGFALYTAVWLVRQQS